MAGIKNYNLSGVASDLQLGKRGGRLLFEEGVFKFVAADGVTLAGIRIDDLVVNGNLTVLGDTTTIDVETVTVTDNIIELNSGETGAGVTSGSSGLEINRGTETNAQLVWDETEDAFRFQLSDGTPVSVLGNFEVPQPSELRRTSDDKVIVDTTNATSLTNEYIALATEEGRVTLSAKNEAGSGDVDLVLTGQGNGTVIFTSESASADGLLAAQEGTNLQLSGGDEDGTGEVGSIILRGGDGTSSIGGDVVLGGGANGGTVRIDILTTTVNDTSSDDTVATVGYVKTKSTDLDNAIVTIQGRLDTNEGAITTLQGDVTTLQGEVSTLTTDVGTISTSIGQIETDLTTQTGRIDTLETNAVTTFVGLTDTPVDYTAASGKYVVVNGTGDGIEFITLPEFSTTLEALSDTPVGYGTAGQTLVVNETLDGMVYADLVDSFIDLSDTPVAMGTTGQILVVGAGGTLEFSNLEANVDTILDLSDVADTYGLPGQVLAVNGTGDGMEFVESRTLSAIEMSDMSSTVATLDATLGAYAVIAQPKEFADSDGTTQSITLTRITVKVSSGVDVGEGIRIRVKNDDGGTEASVIATADMTDTEEGVYVIDGIFQNVTMTPLQVVEAALVDSGDLVVASTGGTVTFYVEYKTNIQ